MLESVSSEVSPQEPKTYMLFIYKLYISQSQHLHNVKTIMGWVTIPDSYIFSFLYIVISQAWHIHLKSYAVSDMAENILRHSSGDGQYRDILDNITTYQTLLQLAAAGQTMSPYARQ